MADYVRAMYTLDAGIGYDPATDTYERNPMPRATLPKLVGGEDATDPDYPSAIDSVVEGYNLYLRLYYYAPLIEGEIGKGKVEYDYSDEPPNEYPNANAAVVPLYPLIGTYTGLNVKRKDGTDHTGEPEVYTNWEGRPRADRTNARSLYDNLQKYWDVYYEYENPRGGDPILLKADWPKMPNISDWEMSTEHGNTVGLTDYDFEAPEAREKRECTATFELLESAEFDEAEWAFEYWMLP